MCSEAESGRSRWEADYPKRGLNFLIWDQKQVKGDTTCTNGIYVEATKMCYTYNVMRQVCMLVKFTKDIEKNTYSWIYTGGCFAGNKPVWYEQADPNSSKNFKDIQFEVRLDHRENSEIANAMKDDDSTNNDSDTLDDDDDDSSTTGKNSTEKPAAKIKREKENLLQQAENGDVKPTGLYIFYHIFKFIAGLALLLAVISIGLLIYFVVQMIKGTSSQD